MLKRLPKPAVKRLPLNTKGKDVIVGDIHGMFDLVLRAMEKMNFDQSCDRLISVGDMIDRGPGSHRTAKFLSCSFVEAVLGNHEGMLLEAYQDGEAHPGVLEFLHSRNGFSWWRDTPDELRSDILDALWKLPLALEIETDRGMVGVVHADVPRGMSWEAFTAALDDGDADVAEVALWGRDRIHRLDETGVQGIGRVYVGHTPLRRVAKLGNVVALDSGAVFGLGREEGALTALDIATGTMEIKTVSTMMRPDDFVFAGPVGDTPDAAFSFESVGMRHG
jgi:serine/threonine protein phosphatase 1